MEQVVEGTTTQRRSIPVWVTVLAFALLLVFLALIAWGLRRAQAGPITIGQPVPAFSLTTFDGQTVHTADLAGKVVVVNFWASWCKPCEQEAVELEQAWQFYRPDGDVVFLGVDYVDTETEALAYLDRFDITYPNGPDLRTAITQMFRTQGVPETYIIGREGKLEYVKKGPFLSLGEIQMAIDPLR
ncbi:MAG: TlpA family protein disulfide reductase [Chloroflexi bacterium]|jgi:cytochrome c biogenesis protein CcmG/thiol:disulfide interchange protein DsbE|nr:TlpA family protein disulfide reductase [Chloroflexota bacterium]